jgi:nitric oxide reductase subunit C
LALPVSGPDTAGLFPQFFAAGRISLMAVKEPCPPESLSSACLSPPVTGIFRKGGSMSSAFTTSAARNIFFGGTVFFLLVFLGLTFDTERKLPARDQRAQLESNPNIAAGKKLWEANNCIGCHTLLGEGAYFAPELGNVYKRRGPEFIKAWIQAQPTGAPGRRQMPQFNFTEQQLDEIVAFLKYASEINTANWPPNIEG